MNNPVEKSKLIIMGGTFLEYPKKFQYEFIKNCYNALNEKKSKTLKEAKKLNENSKHRCVALCLETRPDKCIGFIPRMREFGATRVELGVQVIDNEIYKKTKRGHTVQDVVLATGALRNAGFKIGYHIMPGLPGSNYKKDLRLFKKLFKDKRFKPDQIKIYPCQVMPGSQLEKDYWKGEYNPYSKEKIQKLIIEMMKNIPRYCRVMRVMREIPPEFLVRGTKKIDLRKDIEEILRKEKAKVKEIRYREIGFALQRTSLEKINNDLELKQTSYNVSNGKEHFLEIVNKNDLLFGLLRLDLPKNKQGKKQGAMIRELHVYGKALKLKEKQENASQHRGLGKRLMKKAEDIARKKGYKKIKVISGVGVRGYYKRLGYSLDTKERGEYMVKEL